MANLSTTRTDAAGHRVHPVCRVRVTAPVNSERDEPLAIRFTLRSDGAILKSVRLSNRWSTPTVWTKVRVGFPCCGAESQMAERLAVGLRRQYKPTVTVEPEALR
jgi:hypothetical protein